MPSAILNDALPVLRFQQRVQLRQSKRQILLALDHSAHSHDASQRGRNPAIHLEVNLRFRFMQFCVSNDKQINEKHFCLKIGLAFEIEYKEKFYRANADEGRRYLFRKLGFKYYAIIMQF